MIITGNGPYLEKCKQMFPEDTIFTGFKKGKELSEIYASCAAAFPKTRKH